MKPGHHELNLKPKHSAYVNSDSHYFKSLKEKLTERSTIKYLLTTQTVSVSRTLVASYDISLLVTKCETNNTIGKDLLKPSITAFLKIIQKKDQSSFIQHSNIQ